MNKTVVKNRPSGYSISQGGSYAVAGFDPLNYKVSNSSGKNMIGSGHSSKQMIGNGIIAEIAGSMAGVAGGIAGAYASGGNPYIIAGASTAVGGSIKSLAEMIGLGHKGMKGLGIIPQHFITFVDNLISNKKTFAQIKNAIMNFELSADLKSKLSRAVGSLLKSMSGSGHVKMKLVRKSKMLKGSGGVFQPNISTYGLVKF